MSKARIMRTHPRCRRRCSRFCIGSLRKRPLSGLAKPPRQACFTLLCPRRTPSCTAAFASDFAGEFALTAFGDGLGAFVAFAALAS